MIFKGRLHIQKCNSHNYDFLNVKRILAVFQKRTGFNLILK